MHSPWRREALSEEAPGWWWFRDRTNCMTTHVCAHMCTRMGLVGVGNGRLHLGITPGCRESISGVPARDCPFPPQTRILRTANCPRTLNNENYTRACPSDYQRRISERMFAKRLFAKRMLAKRMLLHTASCTDINLDTNATRHHTHPSTTLTHETLALPHRPWAYAVGTTHTTIGNITNTTGACLDERENIVRIITRVDRTAESPLQLTPNLQGNPGKDAKSETKTGPSQPCSLVTFHSATPAHQPLFLPQLAMLNMMIHSLGMRSNSPCAAPSIPLILASIPTMRYMSLNIFFSYLRENKRGE